MSVLALSLTNSLNLRYYCILTCAVLCVKWLALWLSCFIIIFNYNYSSAIYMQNAQNTYSDTSIISSWIPSCHNYVPWLFLQKKCEPTTADNRATSRHHQKQGIPILLSVGRNAVTFTLTFADVKKNLKNCIGLLQDRYCCSRSLGMIMMLCIANSCSKVSQEHFETTKYII